MTEASNHEREQLLMAYLDGELGESERAQVESMIESNVEHAELLAQWKEQGDLIRALPKHRLDTAFADRVMAAIEVEAVELNSRPATQFAAMQSTGDRGASWQAGAGAIAALAAMLLLTLFAFPGSPAPSTSENTSNQDVNQSGSETENNSSRPREKGPTKPALAKSMEGHSDARGSKNLITPFQADQKPSLEQVLWVDMDSNQTALSDVESVLKKHAMTVSTDGDAVENPQVENSGLLGARFAALHVVATRGQIKRAIVELSQDFQAQVHAISLPEPTQVVSQSLPDGAAPNTVSGMVRQLTPKSLISHDPAANPSSHVDPNELQQLEQWFGLADPEDQSRVVRLLLLIDMTTSAQ